MSFNEAQNFPSVPPPPPIMVIREYDEERDKVAVEVLESQCDLGQHGKPALVTNLLGDPLCRVRNFPKHVMLVAEYGEDREVVGGIRGGIKRVSIGERHSTVNLAYVFGLRVSPTHRRLGVGTKLVQHLEEWCKTNGADYAYMATDCNNEASLNLFTLKNDYIKFRNPAILVQPVHAHNKSLGSGVVIKEINPQLASLIYRKVMSNSVFFPKDINEILHNNLNLGTFMAIPKSYLPQWDPEGSTLPPSYAILSIWNTKDVFQFQVKGVSPLTYTECAVSRIIDTLLPCLRLPSIPNFFKQFGVYFLYGLHMKGKDASRLMKSLCALAHNMAKADDICRAVVAEVGQRDPVRGVIPHWRKFSWAEDLWCIKKLGTAKYEINKNYEPYDWIKSGSSPSVIFVDPRDF